MNILREKKLRIFCIDGDRHVYPSDRLVYGFLSASRKRRCTLSDKKVPFFQAFKSLCILMLVYFLQLAESLNDTVFDTESALNLAYPHEQRVIPRSFCFIFPVDTPKTT